MKKILVLLAEGFEEIEALTPVDYLRRADVEVDMASLTEDLSVTGAHGIVVSADTTLDAVDPAVYDGVYLPGGMPGSLNLRDDARVLKIVRDFAGSGKAVAAICAAPIVLEKAGVIANKRVTGYPGTVDKLENVGTYDADAIVVQDENIFTGRGAAAAVYLSFALITALCGEETTKRVKEGIQQQAVEALYGFSS
ncbi:DJ-1 family glyoxalase III [Murdochiella vaginalis]|uniref:DJ-1 family glyoxalase III n=1 Tax=Murdochiella vaginalis TaxID=1852373 RepID=UPI0008FE959E|nr:DJ-1 family glyoxalase III [Murdochiella vaginalis]